MSHKLKVIIPLCAFFLVQGCNDDDDDSSLNTGSDNPSVGVFLDAPVANVDYSTDTLNGVTNSDGEFEFMEGETVTFAIGDLTFPEVQASMVVTPLNIAGSENVSDPQVVNIIRLLQTLDQDGDPTNGITISDTAKASATQVDFSLSVADFESSTAVTSLIANGGQDSPVTELVAEEDAIEEFRMQLAENDVTVGIVGSWIVDDGENDLLMFNFMDDGTYTHSEVDVSDTEEDSGMEWGTYERDAESNQLTINITFDANGDTGLTDFVGESTDSIAARISDGNLVFDITEDGSEESLSFEALTASGIYGAWRAVDDENDLLMFNFLDDGTYIHMEVDADDTEEVSGMEFGTFTRDEESGQLTVTQTFDENGDTGLTDFVGQSAGAVFVNLVGDQLVLTVDDNGDQVIDGTLIMERI